jgi:hypothetical protein
MVERLEFNPISKIYHFVRMVFKAQQLETVLRTQSAQQVRADKSMNSHQDPVARVQWLFS